MVQVRCRSRSYKLTIDLQDENFKNLYSEPTRPRVLIFGMKHHLEDLYQVCSNYAPGPKNGPYPRGHMLYIGLYRKNMKKILLSEATRLSLDIWYVASPSGPLSEHQT